MIKRFAEGLNYSIDLDDLTATCRVWSRPDLTSAQGAALAQEKVSLFQRLAQGPAAGMLFDLTQAPVVIGPKTQEALGEMMRAWQIAGKPIAVVVGPQSIQQLQLRRLLSEAAPDRGALFTTSEEASAWLQGNQRGSR
jgi:hypothetical protein